MMKKAFKSNKEITENWIYTCYFGTAHLTWKFVIPEHREWEFDPDEMSRGEPGGCFQNSEDCVCI